MVAQRSRLLVYLIRAHSIVVDLSYSVVVLPLLPTKSVLTMNFVLDDIIYDGIYYIDLWKIIRSIHVSNGIIIMIDSFVMIKPLHPFVFVRVCVSQAASHRNGQMRMY
jgi:hypothetical protein